MGDLQQVMSRWTKNELWVPPKQDQAFQQARVVRHRAVLLATAPCPLPCCCRPCLAFAGRQRERSSQLPRALEGPCPPALLPAAADTAFSHPLSQGGAVVFAGRRPLLLHYDPATSVHVDLGLVQRVASEGL